MRLSISLSADARFKKGDRVVCKAGKNEWYLGVVRRGGAKMVVDFDDGLEADVSPEDLKDVKLVDPSTKKRKKFLTNAQAMQLYSVKPALKKAAEAKKTASKTPAVKKTASKTPAVKKTASKTPAKKKSKKLPLPPKIEGDPVLFDQYSSSRSGKGTSLNDYLEGAAVPKSWISAVKNRLSKNQPSLLYRLAVVSLEAGVGKTINVTKDIVSASDTKTNAIYAGCSFHHDEGTDIRGKQLAVIEIHNPVTCISFDEILGAVKLNNFYSIERTDKEREYIIKGPVSGKIIEMVPTSMITEKTYRTLVSMKDHKTQFKEAKAMLLAQQQKGI